MQLSVLGGCGAWPDAGQACSGFLVEQDGFAVLVDAGYAVVPRLLSLLPAGRLDAVLISHGHPDHCADLNPLLRARALGGEPLPPLPVYAPAGALDAVLALDRPGIPTCCWPRRPTRRRCPPTRAATCPAGGWPGRPPPSPAPGGWS
jgi:ribonuclease BN (tRNA processing enzyme)